MVCGNAGPEAWGSCQLPQTLRKGWLLTNPLLALAHPLTSCASQHSGAGLPPCWVTAGRAGVPTHSDPCARLLEPALPRATLGSCHSFGMQGCLRRQQELGLSWEGAALLPWWPCAHPSPRQVMMGSSVPTCCPTLPTALGQGFEGWAGSCLAALGIPVGLGGEEELSALRSLCRSICHPGVVF